MADESIVSPVNPANFHSWSGVIKEILRNHDIGFECCIPVVVSNVYAGNRIVDVIPLVKLAYKTENGMTYKDRATIYSIPVRRIVSGGYIISMPIKTGDTGWLIACDRDSALAVKYNNAIKSEDNPGAQPPASLAIHEYANGFFLPDNWADIGGGNALTLAKYDDTGALVNSIQIDEDNISINAKSTVNITGDVTITGTLAVSEAAVFNKKITGNDDIVSIVDNNSVSLRDHTHKYLDDTGDDELERETASPGADVQPSEYIKVGGAMIVSSYSSNKKGWTTTTKSSIKRADTTGITVIFTAAATPFGSDTYGSPSWSGKQNIDGVVSSISVTSKSGLSASATVTIPASCKASYNVGLYAHYSSSQESIIWN